MYFQPQDRTLFDKFHRALKSLYIKTRKNKFLYNPLYFPIYGQQTQARRFLYPSVEGLSYEAI
jgi:hypothetical protein